MATYKLLNSSVIEKLAHYSMPEPNSGCQLWLAGTNRHGYGRVWLDGGPELAHRVAYEEANGPIPEGLKVLHKCDVPACVNPNHLKLGSQSDNMADMVGKGRFYSKLSASDVLAIRDSAASATCLAKQHRVDASLIRMIRQRRIWRHV